MPASICAARKISTDASVVAESTVRLLVEKGQGARRWIGNPANVERSPWCRRLGVDGRRQQSGSDVADTTTAKSDKIKVSHMNNFMSDLNSAQNLVLHSVFR